MFVTGSKDMTVKVWDTNRMEAVLTLQSFEGAVYDTCMSPLETCRHNLVAISGEMNHVTLGDVGMGTATHILSGHTAPVWTCAWSCRSEWELISGSQDGQVRLWDIRRPGTRWVFDMNDSGAGKGRGKLEHAQAHEAAVTSCAAVPGSGLFWATTGNDGRPKLWDMYSKKHMMKHYQKRCSKSKFVRRLGFSDDGRVLFHPSESLIHIFDVMGGNLVRTLQGGHYAPIYTAVWNEKYEQLYSGGADKSLLVWGVPARDIDSLDSWSEDEYCY